MTDIETQLKRSFGNVKRAKGSWLRVICPTCDPKDAKKMKRYVSTTSDYTKCFICSPGGMRTSELLTGNVQIKLEERSQVKEEKKEHPWARKMPGYRFTPIHELPHDHPAVQFFHKDHLFDLERYYNERGVVYCPSDAGVCLFDKPYTTSAERIIFPVYFNKEFIGWQMRSIPGTFYGDRPDVIKYIHMFDKGDILYNYDYVKENYNMVIVTEGIKKALKFPNGVATLGKGLTSQQIALIAEWDRIVIMLDGEDKTQKEARELVFGMKLNGSKNIINIDLRKHGYPSPDEAPQDELMKIVHKEWTEYEQRKSAT